MNTRMFQTAVVVRFNCFFCFLLSLFLCAACSSKPPAPPAATGPKAALKVEKPAITQIVQTFNVPIDSAWQLIMDTLHLANRSIKLADPDKHQILLDWVPVQDALCGVNPPSGAMLSCRVQILIRLQSLTDKASAFTVSYLEECFDYKSLNIECPNSNAEKLLFQIAEEMKTALSVR